MIVRISAPALVLLILAACAPAGPAPVQCTADSDCFTGGVCNAGGTCVTGAAVDADKSTIDISQPNAVADGKDEVAITVTLRDAAGNPLLSRGVQLAVDGTGNTLTQPSLASNSVGQVVGKLTTTKAETKNISAIGGIVAGQSTAKGIALSKKTAITFVADASHVACAPGVTSTNCTPSGANGSSFSITAPDGVSAPNVVVDTTTGVKLHLVLKDANGNPIAGATVNFSAIGTSITPPSGTAVTGADGSFDATLSSTVAQVAQVVLTAGGISVSKTVTFKHGPLDTAHSTIATKVGATECGVTAVPVCTITATNDGSTGKIEIAVSALDAFDNPIQDETVWFDAGGSTTDNTFAGDVSETAYCAGKTPAAVICVGQQTLPFLTQADGVVLSSFTSIRAETKSVTVHLGAATLPLTFNVTAGGPDGTMSQFVVLGHADGTPVIANAQLGAAADDSWLVGAYVADKFDNPIEGVAVSFASVACTGGPPCTPGSTVPGDVFVPLQAPDTGKTDTDGTYSTFLSALVAGTRALTVTGTPLPTSAATVTADFAPGPVSLNGSSLQLSASSISADPGHVTHITITLNDANNNPAPNQDLTLDAKVGSGTGASCVPCSFTLPSNTGAVYTADLSSSTAGSYVVTADVTLPGVVVPLHMEQALTVIAGGVNPGNSTVATVTGAPGPGTTSSPLTADNTAHANVVVTLKDTQGNPVDGQTVLPGGTGSGNTISAVTAGATGSGQYFFNIKSTVAEKKTVSVLVGGTPGPKILAFAIGQTVQFTFVPGAPVVPGAAPSTFTASPTTVAAGGSGTNLVLTVKDANGNPVPNFAIAFSDSPANGAFSVLAPANGQTDASGKLTVTYKSGVAASESIIAKSGATTFLTVPVTVVAAAASPVNSSMTPVAPSVVADGTTTTTLNVVEKDGVAAGNPINHCVHVTSSGAATIGADALGVSAATSFTVSSTVAGPQTFTAFDIGAGCPGTLPGTPFAQATVTFTADPAHLGAPTIGAVPTSIPADFSTTSTLSVTVKDVNGNLVPTIAVGFGSSVVTDSFTCSSGCNTDVNGVATTQVKAKVAGVHTITPTITGVASPPSASVTVTPGAASQIAFTQQPVNVNAGTPMAPVKVTIEDQFGNAVPTAASITVNVALATSNGGTAGSLANNAVSSAGGVATFNGLIPTGTAGGLCDASNNPCRTLVASASGLTAVGPSSQFHIVLPFGSNGSEGAINATSGTLIIPANNGTPHQYTTITIAAGARVIGDGNGVLDLRAQGDVNINGTLDVSGGNGGSVGGAVNGGGGGGGAGNATGGANGPYDAFSSGGNCINGSGAFAGCSASIAGLGGGGGGGNNGGGPGGTQMGGGGGGGSASSYDYYAGGGGGGGGAGGGAGGFAGADGCIAAGAAGAGSSGGSATGCGTTAKGGGQSCAGAYAGANGAIGSSACTPIAGSGGGGSIGCDAANDLAMASTFRPGSGGGGGGNGGDHNGEARSGGGGGGGGGGGALRITSPTRIVLGSTGVIAAHGGNGGNGGTSGDDCVDDSGGGGGGGSGGALWLQAPILTVPSGATVAAAGGGGGAAGATTAAGPGGGGGLGRVRLSYDPSQSSVAGTFNPPLPSGANASGKAFIATYPQ